MTAAPAPAAASHRALVTRGLAWNGVFQVFQTVLGFAVTMALVRLMPPSEYGKSGAVVGALALLNSFGAQVFLAHALQHGDGEEPDWSRYWSGALWLQAGHALLCQALAGGCWLLPVYRPIAPLLHVAGIGLLLQAPAHLATVRLRRDMDYRRLRILSAIAALGTAAVTLGLGLAGAGAWALVLGANVLLSVPLVVDLLLVQRFRPRDGWLRAPDLAGLRPAIHFGLRQGAGALLWAARAAVPAAVLPATLGYDALGLLGRAAGIYQSSAARVVSVLLETVYPLLPRWARERERYARHATLLLQAVAWIAIPSALFLLLAGPDVSRVLYGLRWAAADPVIFPAALGTLAVLLCTACASALLGVDRLRACLVLDTVGAALALPTIAVTLVGGRLATYAWALGVAQLAGAAVALAATAPLLARGWWRRVLLAPLAGSLVGGAGAWLVERSLVAHSVGLRLPLAAATFAALLVATLRLLDPPSLAALLAVIPGGRRAARMLALPADEAADDVAEAADA